MAAELPWPGHVPCVGEWLSGGDAEFLQFMVMGSCEPTEMPAPAFDVCGERAEVLAAIPKRHPGRVPCTSFCASSTST